MLMLDASSETPEPEAELVKESHQGIQPVVLFSSYQRCTLVDFCRSFTISICFGSNLRAGYHLQIGENNSVIIKASQNR